MTSNDIVTGFGPEGTFEVTCEGRKFNIDYVINIRNTEDNTNVNSIFEMAKETLRHFKHAAHCLAAGLDAPAEGVGERTKYFDTDEPLVSGWTFRSCFVVPYEDEIYKVPVNICIERTSALQLINDAWTTVRLMSDELFIDDFRNKGSIIKVSPVPEISNPKQMQEVKQPVIKSASTKSELDEYFSRDNGQPADGIADDNDGENHSPYLGGYDYKLKPDYIAKYGKKTVKFDVMKLSRKYNSATGLPDVEVTSSYSGKPSQFPAFTIKNNRIEKVDEYTQQILLRIMNAPQNEPYVDKTYYIGTFFMNLWEDRPDQVYPLLVKLEPVDKDIVDGIEDDKIEF